MLLFSGIHFNNFEKLWKKYEFKNKMAYLWNFALNIKFRSFDFFKFLILNEIMNFNKFIKKHLDRPKFRDYFSNGFFAT